MSPLLSHNILENFWIIEFKRVKVSILFIRNISSCKLCGPNIQPDWRVVCSRQWGPRSQAQSTTGFLRLVPSSFPNYCQSAEFCIFPLRLIMSHSQTGQFMNNIGRNKIGWLSGSYTVIVEFVSHSCLGDSDFDRGLSFSDFYMV